MSILLSYQYTYETSDSNISVNNDVFLVHVISLFWNDWNTYFVK